MEKEILERLHANITLNQAKNFELLKKQHEYLVKWHKQEMSTFDHLKTSQAELWQQMQSVQHIHAQTANQIQMIFDTLVLVRNSTELIVSKYNSMVHYHMQELQSQLNQLAIRQAMEIDQLVHSVLGDLAQIEQGLSKMVTAQHQVIKDWEETKRIQKEYINIWQESIEQVNDRLNEVMNHSLQHLRSIKQEISIVQDQISWLILPFKWLHAALTNFYFHIRIEALKLLIHALMFNYVFNEITSGFIKKFVSALASAALHYYLYSLLREAFIIESTELSFDCFLILVEFVIANRLPFKLVKSISSFFSDNDNPIVDTPNSSIGHDDNNPSISPAEVSQDENNNLTHTNNFNHYHFHNYYIKEPDAIHQVATDLDEEDFEGSLPMKVGEYTHPVHH
ncbi:hypothetical protein [Parasitella parasitica]|uniref:Uncharacterized protein n=1 Tax=Parasitella parasitica TaxID=35722 RepID=A0A0B7NM18_9FUNG|nr:hypothetical protein [Parasitella parasitica]